jgi:N-methylhydantoinase A
MRAMQLGAMARYVGQSSEIAETLALEEAPAVLAALPEAFALEHERTYGFRAPPEEPVELTSLSLVARGIPGAPRLPASIPPRPSRGTARRPTWFASTGWVETQVIDRADLAAGGRQGPVPGPVIIQEYDATCLVPPGMGVALDGFGNLVLRPAG